MPHPEQREVQISYSSSLCCTWLTTKEAYLPDSSRHTTLDAHQLISILPTSKALAVHTRRPPDVITINQGNVLRTMGELKVPRVEEHRIKKAFHNEQQLRVLLAQIIDYMQDLNCKYVSLSNYDETIFLQQRLYNGSWEIEYALVITASAAHVKLDRGPPIVSVR